MKGVCLTIFVILAVIATSFCHENDNTEKKIGVDSNASRNITGVQLVGKSNGGANETSDEDANGNSDEDSVENANGDASGRNLHRHRFHHNHCHHHPPPIPFYPPPIGHPNLAPPVPYYPPPHFAPPVSFHYYHKFPESIPFYHNHWPMDGMHPPPPPFVGQPPVNPDSHNPDYPSNQHGTSDQQFGTRFEPNSENWPSKYPLIPPPPRFPPIGSGIDPSRLPPPFVDPNHTLYPPFHPNHPNDGASTNTQQNNNRPDVVNPIDTSSTLPANTTPSNPSIDALPDLNGNGNGAQSSTGNSIGTQITEVSSEATIGGGLSTDELNIGEISPNENNDPNDSSTEPIVTPPTSEDGAYGQINVRRENRINRRPLRSGLP